MAPGICQTDTAQLRNRKFSARARAACSFVCGPAGLFLMGLSLAVVSEGRSLWLQRVDFLRCLLLLSTGSRRAGFSAYGVWAVPLRHVGSSWSKGSEAMFPVLAGRFLTAGSSGSTSPSVLINLPGASDSL